MDCTLQRDLDPLDLEVVERALQGAWDAIKTGSGPVDLESDEELELALRSELAKMVRASGISDPDVLLDILIEGMSENFSEARPQSHASSRSHRKTGELEGTGEALPLWRGFFCFETRPRKSD